MYFVMARMITAKERQEMIREETESEDDGSLNSRYESHSETGTDRSLLEEEEDEDEQEDEGEQESREDSYNSYESRESRESKSPENSPPFKQAKYDRTDSQALLNNMYSNRNSLSSNYENVLRASHSGVNLSKNYIDSDNHDKKLKYMSKKVFLQLPSCLYRMKLNAIELDSFEASRISIQTKQIEKADFLQEFGILRQNYALPHYELINDMLIYIENAFKDVYSLEGDESAYLEIIFINNILLFICKKFDDIFKLLEKAREILFS